MKDDPFAELDKLRKQKPLPRPIAPIRRTCRVMPVESIEARAEREELAWARNVLAGEAAEAAGRRFLEEGRKKLPQPAPTQPAPTMPDQIVPDKINQILKKHRQKAYGLTNNLPLSGKDGGYKSVIRFLKGKSKTVPGGLSAAKIAEALTKLCNSPISEQDITSTR